MTVMIDRFFGVHPEVIRAGLLSRLREGEIRLYLALMERSEYLCTRELTLTDEQFRDLVKVAPRTSCNARKKLQEVGLIQYRRGGGNKYVYVICDPTTGKPYPGDPKVKIPYQKVNETHPSAAPRKTTAPGGAIQSQDTKSSPKVHGLPLSFD